MARKVKFDFNPFSDAFSGIQLRGRKREQAMRAVSDFVVEKVLQRVASSTSPVSKQGRFRSLSPDYRDRKQDEGLNGVPNLEFEGDMLDSLDVVRQGESTLRLTVSDGEQGKADGHNNFTGRSTLPRRPFIPDSERGEVFKRDIMDGISRIVRRIRDA